MKMVNYNECIYTLKNRYYFNFLAFLQIFCQFMTNSQHLSPKVISIYLNSRHNVAKDQLSFRMLKTGTHFNKN